MSIFIVILFSSATYMNTPYYSRFDVKIVDKAFYAENGVKYPKTAIISFLDEKQHVINTVDYGHISTIDIYNAIDDTKSIKLDYCYVNNFSITAYRRTRILNKKEYVELDGISAKGAFFDSKHEIDFSFIKVGVGKIDFSTAHFAHGKFNFTHTNFGDGVVDFSSIVVRSKQCDFSNAVFGEGEVSFKNAIFYRGEKNFQYADFGDGNLSFQNTEFGDGNVLFINSVFGKGKVFFKVARFGKGNIDFHYSKFKGGDISFERVEFGSGIVTFKTVEFGKGKVNFNRAVFGDGDKSFEGCSADGRMTFKKTFFGNGGINFELAELENTDLSLEKSILGTGAVSFFNSQFKSLSLSGCQINDYLDLRVQKCGLINLSDTIVRDIIDFKPYEYEVKIDALNIYGMRLLGVIYIDWRANNVKNIICNCMDTSLSEKAEEFRVLKESFNKAGQYSDEDFSYVWFKRYEELSDYKAKTKQKPLIKIYEYPFYLFRKLVFDKAGLYATNPIRVLFSMVATLSFFGLVYSLILVTGAGGIVSGIGGDHNLIGTIGRSFYHSGITFFTIGYGDFYPLGAIRWLSNLEGFVGVFLMSYFTVAFVRKILR